jgi:hypothetical protein
MQTELILDLTAAELAAVDLDTGYSPVLFANMVCTAVQCNDGSYIVADLSGGYRVTAAELRVLRARYLKQRKEQEQ